MRKKISFFLSLYSIQTEVPFSPLLFCHDFSLGNTFFLSYHTVQSTVGLLSVLSGFVHLWKQKGRKSRNLRLTLWLLIGFCLQRQMIRISQRSLPFLASISCIASQYNTPFILRPLLVSTTSLSDSPERKIWMERGRKWIQIYADRIWSIIAFKDPETFS